MNKQIMGIGVGVMIQNEKGQVLLGKRAENEVKTKLKGSGAWTMPGGKVDFGETFETAAIREVKEETNLDVIDLEMVAVNEDFSESVHFVTIGCLVKNFSGELKTMEPNKITEWGWFDRENLPEPMYFPSEKLLRNVREEKVFIKNN